MGRIRGVLISSSFLIFLLSGCVQDILQPEDEGNQEPVSETTDSTDTTKDGAQTTDQTNTAVSDPKVLLNQAYLCSEYVSGFDSCYPRVTLMQTKSHTFMKSSKLINGTLKPTIYRYVDGDFEAQVIINDLTNDQSTTETQFSLDYSADTIVTYPYSEAGVTSLIVTSIDTSVSPVTVTHTVVGIPTDEISGVFPLHVENNVLYGAGIRTSDGGKFLYMVDYSDSANVTVTRLAGYHDGTFVVANWSQPGTWQLRYSWGYVRVIGNILFAVPYPSQDLNGDAIAEDSEVYWINLDDQSVGGYYTINQNVQADKFIVHNNELYFSYGSSSQQMWVKASVSGTGATASAQFATVYELAEESPKSLLSAGGTLYASSHTDLNSQYDFSIVNTSDYSIGKTYTVKTEVDTGGSLYYVDLDPTGYVYGKSHDSGIYPSQSPIEIGGRLYMSGTVGGDPNDFGAYWLEFIE
ncbi:MAG: hypothetical protein OEX19_00285 [Gammaproteobacteria bacterium]|nr:hypothetical protein [Gammaproteobacteria bacterium]